MKQRLTGLLAWGLRSMNSLDWLAPLLMRIYFGYFWVETGWGKIQNLEAFTEKFVGWGVPYPHFSAVLSGYTEWLGGLLIMAGLFTRVASIPMMFNMLVAIVKVKIKEVSGVDDFVEMDEALYLLILSWLMMAGPGRASLDYLIERRLGIDSTAHEALR
jgi:putative oxidoreductase